MRNRFLGFVVFVCLMVLSVLTTSIAFGAIDDKSSAGIYTGKKIHSDLTTDIILQEGFESWYPAGWDQVVTNSSYTWYQTTDTYYDGAAAAEIVYDPAYVPQNEWMISPSLDFTNASEITLEFWFYTSYYWHVDPYDNGDMEIRFSTDDGATWTDPIWTEEDYGTFETFEWYNVSLDLADLIGEPNCKIALVFEGEDGAQAVFDGVSIDAEIQVDHDVALLAFVAPDQVGDPNVAVTPEVTVRNFGSNDETFDINFVIELEGTEVYSETYDDATLTSGQTNSFTFSAFTPDQAALYDIYAEVVLEGDQNANNNTLSMIFNTLPYANYNYDFEDGDANFAGNNDWQQGTITTGPREGHSGTCAWGTLIDGEYTVGPLLSSLITPAFTIGNEGLMTFYNWYDTENLFDGGNVKISTDNGATWELIVPANGYDGVLDTSYQNPIMAEEAFMGENTTWTMESFDLTAYAGDTVMFRFDWGSDESYVGGDGWYIDDFHLEYLDEAVGVDNDVELLPANFSLNQNYPNPFNAQTEISFNIANEADVELVIFNSLGQIVETLVSEKMSAGSHSVNWDASDVSSGIYYYKLSASGQTEVRALTLIK